MVSGYFVKNKMSKDNKIYSNLNTKKRFIVAKRNVVKLIIDNSLLISNNIK